ncbi:MAG: SusC/RagA family TonB-linked outer membrane protein [Gemmatimonadaceae bacterium]|nr:SusC/RagA family TonB-linked outer membrane protein [Gemmatimonadaceae bacterium]
MLGRIGIRGLNASILALLLSITTASVASAQGATITGRVASEAGQPLYGANVTIDALTISVGTTEEGRYTINIPGARVRGQQVVLRARMFGFVPVVRTITVSAGSQTQDFALKQDVNRLSQVVVTGVSGATEVKKLPFTVAQVTAEDMPVPGANPLAQLQGKVPGANIVSASGRPGSAPAVILRGPQSINASGRGQDPLYIIDGVISQGGIQDINPQDIENVEVVKGAAASSLYGSRAGNGVIQITTRSGKNAGEGVRFRSQVEYGTSSIENEYLYPKTHFMLMNEDKSRYCVVVAGAPDCSRAIDIEAETYRINNDGPLFALTPATFVNDAGIARNPGPQNGRNLYQINQFVRTYNPIRQVLTNGETINATADATGRVGRTNFFASANQYRQEGAVRLLDGYTRNSLRVNVDQQLASAWNFSVRSNYTDATDNNTGFSWFRVTRQPANASLLTRDTQGRLFIRSVAQQQGAQNQNPMYDAENFRPVNRVGRFIGQATARWQPLLWLDAEGNIGYDTRANQQDSQQDKGYRTTTGPGGATQLGNISRSSNLGYSLNASADLTARRNWFSDNLTSRLTFRTLYETQVDRGLNAGGSTLAVPGLRTIAATLSTTRGGGNYEQTVRQLGMFVNLDLDWQGKYILSGLVRRDGASLFGSARRWQTYGRGSAAWRISEESWFGVDAISDLKFRFSLGQAGNRPNFSAQYETYGLTGAGLIGGLGQIGNPNLRPEVSTEQEFGFDLELFSKYGITVTQANNTIDQQIMPVPVAAIGGFTSQWNNVGELSNKTFEVSLNIPIIQTRDLNYSIRATFDRTRSVISRLDIPTFFNSAAGQQGSETMFKFEQGGRMGEIFGRRFVTKCSELEAAFASQCGGAGSAFQKNSDGYIVYVGAGNTLGDGITKNLWNTRLASTAAPWNGGTGREPLNWGMPILFRDANGAVPAVTLGQALPHYRWGLSQQASGRKFTAYALLDATVGKSVWNEARQWSLGDFMHRDTDQQGKNVANAKPIGYYFRATSSGGIGGLYDVLGPNNQTVEDATFVKVREVSVGYRIGRLAGVGDWSLSMVGRNLLTISDYRGFDPEVGVGGGNLGSGVLNAIDAFGFPNLRTFSFQLSTSF